MLQRRVKMATNYNVWYGTSKYTLRMMFLGELFASTIPFNHRAYNNPDVIATKLVGVSEINNMHYRMILYVTMCLMSVDLLCIFPVHSSSRGDLRPSEKARVLSLQNASAYNQLFIR